MTEIDALLDEMELAGPRERAVFEAALNGTLINLQTPSASLNEALSADDLQLVNAIVSRFDKLIKGDLLISFLALRQQIKAIQKEIADMRKQDDKDSRKLEKIESQVNKLVEQEEKDHRTLEDISDQVDKLTDHLVPKVKSVAMKK